MSWSPKLMAIYVCKGSHMLKRKKVLWHHLHNILYNKFRMNLYPSLKPVKSYEIFELKKYWHYDKCEQYFSKKVQGQCLNLHEVYDADTAGILFILCLYTFVYGHLYTWPRKGIPGTSLLHQLEGKYEWLMGLTSTTSRSALRLCFTRSTFFQTISWTLSEKFVGTY